MTTSPHLRMQIHKLVDEFVIPSIPSDPRSIDDAMLDKPGAWDIASITGERHGYGYHVILNCGSAGYPPIIGKGHDIATAIRDASAKAKALDERDTPG